MFDKIRLSFGAGAVLAFLLEALFYHSRVPGLNVSFQVHMLVTAAILSVFSLVGVFRLRTLGELGANRLHSIRRTSIILVAWGLVSCLVLPISGTNLAFWLLWSLQFYTSWWVIPAFVSSRDRERMFVLFFFLCTVVSLLAHVLMGEGMMGRLVGFFGSATTAGRFLALAMIFWVVRWIVSGSSRGWIMSLFALSTGMLIMTRTRASMAAGLLGCATVVLGAFLGGGRSGQAMPARRASVLVAGIGFMLMFVLASGYFTNEDVVTYVRMDGGVSRVYEVRSMNWEAGLRDLPSYGLIGFGFVSKFAETSSATFMGLSLPRYDWTTESDPLNMLLLMSKQIGIPGGILLALLLFNIWIAAGRLMPPERLLARGVMAAGLVFGLLDGNWLTSFGDPVDRFSLIALATLFGSTERESRR